MNSTTFKEISDFIVKTVGCDISEISEETRLRKDLGVAGQDGVELMDKFFTQFEIEVEEFNYSNYFEGEGFGILDLLRFRRKKLLEIRVKDLILIADKGCYPPPND